MELENKKRLEGLLNDIKNILFPVTLLNKYDIQLQQIINIPNVIVNLIMEYVNDEINIDCVIKKLNGEHSAINNYIKDVYEINFYSVIKIDYTIQRIQFMFTLDLPINMKHLLFCLEGCLKNFILDKDVCLIYVGNN